MADNISQKLWSQFTAAIAANLGPADAQASIQILPQAVRLPQAASSEEELTNTLNLFFNSLPQWGSAYLASNRIALQAYQAVLQQINPAPNSSAELQKRYQEKMQQAQDAAEEASKYQKEKMSGFSAQQQKLEDSGVPSQAIPSWDQYWKPFEQVFATMTANGTKLNVQAMDLVKAQATGQAVEALGKLNGWMKEHQENPIPYWNFVTDPWKTLNGWTKGNGKTPLNTSISSNSRTYDYAKSTWSQTSSRSVFFGLWSKTGTTRGSTESSLTKTSNFSVDFAYDATALLTAAPSPDWYNGTVLRNYKSGPWIPDSQFAKGDSHPWGNEGVFPLMVTAVWVVFNPTITIQLDTTSYKTFKSAYQSSGGGGASIGPFFKNPSSRSRSDTKTNTDFKDESSTVIIEDTSDIPQVVGITNQIMP